MTIDNTPDTQAFLRDVERELGRKLSADDATLAASLQHEKSPALVARELKAAIVADPKKIRPEHIDAANEPGE